MFHIALALAILQEPEPADDVFGVGHQQVDWAFLR